MNGINGNVYYDLDQYIDIQKFNSLYEEICYGISLSDINQGYIGGYTLDEDIKCLEKEIQNYERMDNDSIEKKFGNKIVNIKSKILYIKLISKSMSLANTIYIKKPSNYSTKHISKDSKWTINAGYFTSLIQFIDMLPFKEYGRIVLFLNDHGVISPIHKDTINKIDNDEFIYLRIRNYKPFFIFDENQNTKHYIKSISSFFNSNDYHGSDPSKFMCFSIRIDGIFTDDFRSKLQLPRFW